MIDIKIDKFQGPLSLLLQIIEKEELDITTLNLAKIADEYLDYVKNCEEIRPESMADFLLMAAKLLYIKSRALLPYLISEEDQEEIDDLEEKLKIYKDFVGLSAKIQKMVARKKFSFSRPLSQNYRRLILDDDNFFPPKNIDHIVLQKSFKKVLQKIEFLEERLEERVLIPEINIEERITFIKKTLSEKVKLNFSKILREAKTRTEIIVNFLAILELIKQKEVVFKQDQLFGEILVKSFSEVNSDLN